MAVRWNDTLITSLEAFGDLWPMDSERLTPVTRKFPFRLSPYFLSLIGEVNDPAWRQVVPEEVEMEDANGLEDPLAEEALSPVPNLVHRYPNRVLWLVSHECALHCRFCTRKRRWRTPLPMTDEILQEGLGYIRRHEEIQDVLLSGGDPLLLPLSRLEAILSSLRKISHVRIIRIGTRIPVAWPDLITPALAEMMARHHPVYINIHFNHPMEITARSRRACATLASTGIPLGSQTVLLKGINDRPETLAELFQDLLTLRVRPYYLLQMDLTRGTAHFRTPLGTGLHIMQALRNHISGLAMPHFIIDLPGGHGKIPLVPRHVDEIADGRLILRDFRGALCEYPLMEGEDEELARWLGRRE